MFTETREELIERYEQQGDEIPALVQEAPKGALFNWGYCTLRHASVPLERFGVARELMRDLRRRVEEAKRKRKEQR